LGQKLGDALDRRSSSSKPGANGNVGAEFVAKAAPDGYTSLLSASAPSIGGVYPTLGYDPVKDFSPVTMVVFAAHPRVNPQVGKFRGELVAGEGEARRSITRRRRRAAPHLAGIEFATRAGSLGAHRLGRGRLPTSSAAGDVCSTACSRCPTRRAAAARRRRVGAKRVSSIPTCRPSPSQAWASRPARGRYLGPRTPRDIVARLGAEVTDAATADMKERWGHRAPKSHVMPLDEFAASSSVEKDRWAKVEGRQC
jgi:hypothetical protein